MDKGRGGEAPDYRYLGTCLGCGAYLNPCMCRPPEPHMTQDVPFDDLAHLRGIVEAVYDRLGHADAGDAQVQWWVREALRRGLEETK